MQSLNGMGLGDRRRRVGQIVFWAVSLVVIVLAGGGIDFLRQPVGVSYTLLWAAWGTVTALGRERGVPSSYDRKQRGFMALGFAIAPILFAGPPFEYAHLAGPIPRDGALAWFGLALFGVGVAVQTLAMWALHGLYTVRLGMQPGHQLVKTGPYRLVRHPGYLGYFICMIGIGLSLGSLIAFALTVYMMPLILWRMGREEEMLLAEFGDEYRTYMRQTKRMIPLIY